MIVEEPPSDYGQSEPKAKTFVDRVNWLELADLPILRQLSQMKEQIDAMRPFSRNMERHVMDQMIRNWHYNTNAIEGNKLTYGETIALLLHGVTAKGKPLKDHLDIIGHRDAVDLMLAMVKDTESPLRQTDIRQLHKIMLKEDYQQKAITATGREVFRTIHVGVYKREPNHVMTSQNKKHHYAEPAAVPGLMTELVDWHAQSEQKGQLHPLLRAAVLHHEFVAIHPFDDGNGRITRLLMNFSLMRAGYPLVVVPVDDRLDYYRSLEQADDGDFRGLVNFLGENLYNSLDIMLSTARGEDIGGSKWDTPDDDPR
ncbi:MAG: Fic family protein [Bacteroidota bacterium]